MWYITIIYSLNGYLDIKICTVIVVRYGYVRMAATQQRQQYDGGWRLYGVHDGHIVFNDHSQPAVCLSWYQRDR